MEVLKTQQRTKITSKVARKRNPHTHKKSRKQDTGIQKLRLLRVSLLPLEKKY